MTFGTLFIIVLALGLLAILARLILRTPAPRLKDGGPPPERVENLSDNVALDRARERFRDGGTMRFGEKLPRGDAGFRPSVRQAAVSQIHLTPRNLSLINSRRRSRGLPAMNRRGFQAAIAAAPVRPSASHDDWLTYLIIYECLFADHQGRTPDTSITVTPDAPFNGQGGTFAGAGASGDWPAGGDPAPATIEPGSRVGLGLAVGAAAAAYAVDPLSDPNSYKGGDRLDPSDGGPEAYNPPQSAPEPSRAPEPSYDSGSSSGGGDSGGGSSSSSSSYDSGGSSGGGDSGGGGGGGGGGGD